MVATSDTIQLLAAIVNSSDDAIVSKTVDGIVTSWNSAAEKIFGYSASEMVGRSISVLAVPGNEREMPDILERIKRGDRVDHFETTRRRKDGSLVWISLSVSPIVDEHSRIVGASKIARDITAARAAVEALEAAKQQIEVQRLEVLHSARLAELGQMAAVLTHEITQPLSAVSNYLSAADRLLSQPGPQSLDKSKEAVHRAREQVERTGDIVRRLREFAKPGHGETIPVSVSEIIEEAMSLAAPEARQRGVRIAFASVSPEHLVMADKVQIEQVLLNLLRNSVDAMAERPKRQITLSATRVEAIVEIRVTDTGPGLPEQVRDRLFQPFVTTKASGVGIGLSICNRIVERHGGRIWLEQEATTGATFAFSLPAALET